MRFLATVVSIAVGTASGIAPEEYSFAFEEITVDDLGAVPSDECFYDVTIPILLTKGWTKYAWIPWSKLSNASLELAPHGAFVYKTTNDTLVYEAIKLVPIDTPEAILFGTPEPFCTAAKTFEEITSGKVNCSADDEGMNGMIRTGLNCWASPMSYTTNEPFVNYDKFAWVSTDVLKCGEYVYEMKDGTGLVQHSCDGPDTNAQFEESGTTMDDASTATDAPFPGPAAQDETSAPTASGSMMAETVVAAVAMAAGAIVFV